MIINDIMHDQDREFLLINEVIDSLSVLNWSFWALVSLLIVQILAKTHFSVTFSSRVSSDRLRYDKKC